MAERVTAAGYTIHDPRPGVTLQAALLPGANEFGDVVLTPAVKKLAEISSHEKNLVLSVLSPARIGVAPLAAGSIRAHNAAHDQRVSRAGKILEKARRTMDGWSHDQSKAFWDAMEGLSDVASLPADAQPHARLFREIIQNWTKTLSDADLLESYIEHYFPHEWQKGTIEGNSLRKLFGRRPMQGPEAFRKQRSIATMRKGLELGFEPISWNPAEQLHRKIIEMSKSLLAREMQRDLIAHGMEVLVPGNKQRPDELKHWQRVPESALGVKYGPSVPAGRVIYGHYYAPPEVVRLLENFISPGLWGKSMIYDAYKTIGNLSTSMLLGWSSFHLWLTGLESSISKASIAGELMARGEKTQAMKMYAQVGPQGIVRDLMRGYKAVHHFYSRDASANDTTGIIGQIIQAGGGLEQSLFDKEDTPKKFMSDMRRLMGAVARGDVAEAAKAGAKAAMHGPMAVFELPTMGIMNHWVPYLKVSAFLDLAEMEMNSLGPFATLADQRAVLGKAWDAVDDRFGQLRYANLFWDNTFKQVLTGGFLSVGWQVGSIRHGLGALGQVPRTGRKVKALIGGVGTGGRDGGGPRPMSGEPEPGAFDPNYARGVQREASWLFHMAGLVIALSAVYQFLKTGKMLGQKDDGSFDAHLALKDSFYPRNGKVNKSNGREERDAPISYMKDYYSWTHHPVTTLTHKLKPILHTLSDVVANEDFFGNAVYDGNDPATTQLWDIVKFFGKSHNPISLQSATQRAGVGASKAEQAKAWMQVQLVPFSPASAEIERSNLEDYLNSLIPPSHRTKDEAQKAEARRNVRAAMQSGDTSKATAAAREGNLSPKSLQALRRSIRQGPLRSSFARVTWTEAVRAMELATDEEKSTLKPQFVAKGRRAFAEARTAAEREAIRKQLNRLSGTQPEGQS